MLIWILIPLSHPVLLLLSLLLFLLILLYFDRPEKSSDVIIASFFINIFKNIYFTYLAAPGLSSGMGRLFCGMQDLVHRSEIESRPPALGMQSLSHWTT